MPVPSTAPSGSIAPGQLIGGRFKVLETRAVSPAALWLSANDQKRGLRVSLRLLRSAYQRPEVTNVVKQACRDAAQLKGDGICGVLGVGMFGAKQLFVASEHEPGLPLSVCLESAPSPRSADHALTVCERIAAALDPFPGDEAPRCHGALRPSVVFEDGQKITIAELGFGSGLLSAAGVEAFAPEERGFLAPELRKGIQPSAASDVYGVAALFQALVGVGDGATVSSGLQALLEQGLADDPEERFEHPTAFVGALRRMMPSAQVNKAVVAAVPPANLPPPPARPPRQPSAEFDIPVEVGSIRPPDASGSPMVEVNMGVPQPPADDQSASSSGVDLTALLARIEENDAPRWMMAKDGLDHGPFSGRELVGMILEGELGADDALMNMDTGARHPAGEWDDFVEFFGQYTLKVNAKQQAAEMTRSARVEKVSNRAKVAVAAAVLGGLFLIATVTIVTLQSREETADVDVDPRAELFERGEIPISGTAEQLPRRGRRARPSRSSVGGSNPGSYEEAMNRAVDLGDVSQGGGERQLSGAVVAATMNRHVNQLYGCLAQELRSGQRVGRVQIDLAIAGSGQVLGVSTRQGSGGFQRCISGRVQSIRFPSFPAPRMGARYSFSVN